MHGTALDGSAFSQVAGDQYNIRLPPPMPPPAMCTLPADAWAFTGRDAELREITAAAMAAVGTGRPVMAICAVDGMPGVGKTALAVHAGHLLAPHFPDRRLFVDMRGHTPGQLATAPADALASLLTADGMDPRYLPGDVDGRAAMWRDRMAGKRALLILDNAASSEQVTPLLPGSPGCMVVVTSRCYLGDLPSAVPMLLDSLPPNDAARMFVRLAPAAAGEPAKVAELVAVCGHLPLAIALLARLSVRHRSWSTADLIAQAKERLLTVTAESRTIAAAFDLSYTHLPPAQRSFFRFLGLQPGPDITPYAAAALAGLPAGDAATRLGLLLGDRLLGEQQHLRYRMHDLIREYARQLAAGTPPADREEATGRLADYYLHTAFAAERQINPGRDPITLAAARPGALPQQFTTEESAWQWLTAEHANLLAVIEHAVRHGLDAHAWQLPWTMATFLDRRGHWQDLLATHQTALAAASRAGDRAAEASTHRLLSHAYLLVRQPDSAFAHLEQAITTWRELGDRTGQATAHHGFSLALQEQGNHARAISHARQALALYREAGHRTGEANALNTLGASCLQLHDYQQAIDNCRQALDIFSELDDRVGQATATESLGDIARRYGHPGHAAANYQHAAALRRDLRDHYLEAVDLDRLGDIHHQAGDQQAATQAWQRALDILDDLTHPDAARTRAKLAQVTPPGQPRA